MSSSSPSRTGDVVSTSSSEHNLQPFFILQKASSKPSQRKRKLEQSPSKPTTVSAKLDSQTAHPNFPDNGLRVEVFRTVWSKIHSSIKDALRNINAKVFDQIHGWLCQSFDSIKSSGVPSLVQATRPFPILTRSISKQIFTGLILTQNMEFVDDLLTFKELGLYLKSRGCHVANLSSLDFSAKNGIGGCLRGLMRQLLMTTMDAADISILESWYREQGNYDSPLVIIIDDLERCCPSILSDFILMFSEWIVKIPVILIMGVATTLDAPRNILPSNVLQLLCASKFILGSPAERMDAVLEAALLRQCSGFSIGHKVAVYLRKYFLNHDGTLTSFIKALKIACAQHFSMEPLSFKLGAFFEEDCKGESLTSPKRFLRNHMSEMVEKKLDCGLVDLIRLQKYWSTVVLCLYEAGKHHNIRLLDLFCEALDPDFYKREASGDHVATGKGTMLSSSSDCYHQQYFDVRKGSAIFQAIQKVRDLSEPLLCKLLKSWGNITHKIPEMHDKVKELQSRTKFEERSDTQSPTGIIKRHASRSPFNNQELKTKSEKASALINCMVRDHMRPIECIPFHEVVCFKNVQKLQLALIGDARRKIQLDLLEFHKILQCNCCSISSNSALPSMPDTSIICNSYRVCQKNILIQLRYILAQEHGDVINLHDWFQSFKTVIMCPTTKGKRKLKQSPQPKRKKEANESENKSDASIQARFCSAVTELQITGLIRMPSKRRPDYVQRVAFGL